MYLTATDPLNKRQTLANLIRYKSPKRERKDNADL